MLNAFCRRAADLRNDQRVSFVQKPTRFKSLGFLFGLMLSLGAAKAQSAPEWKTAADTLNVKISYSVALCNGNDRILIRVENNSGEGIQVSWDDNLVSGSASFTTEGKQINKSIKIGANQSVTGECGTSGTDRLLCLPVDIFLGGKTKYDINTLVYSITGVSKTTL